MTISGLMKGLGLSACAGVIIAGILHGRAPAPPATSAPRPTAAAAAAEDFVILRAPDGHFWVDAEVNGRAVRFLIDTGASQVTLSPADAARVGLKPLRDDFTARAATANGTVAAAPVDIDSLDLGSIHLDQVTALVHGVDLPQSLLGMSFLNRLGGFSVEGDRLILQP